MKGLIFGILGPAILGVFILVPLITGRFPLFFGVDPQLLGSVVLILAGFGAAMGWIYGLLTARTRERIVCSLLELGEAHSSSQHQLR